MFKIVTNNQFFMYTSHHMMALVFLHLKKKVEKMTIYGNNKKALLDSSHSSSVIHFSRKRAR